MDEKVTAANGVRTPVHIRWMINRDKPEVVEIERLAFGAHGWTEEDFKRALRQRNCIGMVCETVPGRVLGDDRPVVGLMVYQLNRNSLEVMAFAVHPDWRRKGVGQQMAAKLMSKLSSHRRTRIDINVCEDNLPALQFFRSQGFVAIGVRHGYYSDSDLDAISMRHVLPGCVDDGAVDSDQPANRINV